ncbi:MAG: hypothetical protein IJ300_12590, partial [Clostridia bacterium]|nr:hypothetical protein [Clostridia bacterium]
GLAICVNTIIPSLFPFMTLSAFIVKSGILSHSRNLFSVSNVIFRQPDITLPCIIMSMVGGFPVGIKMTNELYENGQLTTEQAQRLCLFCINPGPAFVITAVGVNMLNSHKAGVLIYASLCISSLICGVITSFIGEKCIKKEDRNHKTTGVSSLSASVSDSIQSIFSICGWIILFSGFTRCLSAVFTYEKFNIILSVLEVTKGCSLICGNYPLYIITFIIGFGGACVHCQVMGFIKNMNMKYSYFFISRVLNGFLSGIICYILLLFFPVETDVFADCDSIRGFSFSFSYSAFFVFIFMCVILIFDIDRNRKYDKI